MVVLVKRCVEQQSCIKLEKNDAAAATSFDSLGGGRSELLGSESSGCLQASVRHKQGMSGADLSAEVPGRSTWLFGISVLTYK